MIDRLVCWIVAIGINAAAQAVELSIPRVEDRNREQRATLASQMALIIANLKERFTRPYVFETPGALSRPTIACGVLTYLECCVGFWVPCIKVREDVGQDSELEV